LNEIAAINLYTQTWEPLENSLYWIVNERLRAEDREKVKVFFPFLRLFLSGLEKLPKQNTTVWRGVKSDLKSDVFKKDKTLTFWSFSSCALDMDALEDDQMLGKTGKRTLFALQTETAIDIVQYSMYKSKNEIILPAGLRLKVSSVLDQGDLLLVHLKELPGKMVK